MQAKDLPEETFLSAVADYGIYAYRVLWQTWPMKIVLAKARNLERRGLMECEDSYGWLTRKGYERLGRAPEERDWDDRHLMQRAAAKAALARLGSEERI